MDFLVLHPGALGDILLSLPAIGLLRRTFPGARVTLAANRDFAEVIAGEYAERVISLAAVPLHRLYADVPLPEADLLWWRSFDRIVSWTGSGDAGFERRMADLHPAALVARWRPLPGERVHVSTLFARSLEPWCGSAPPLEPVRLSPPDADLEDAREWLGDHGRPEGGSLLAIHAGAGSRDKRRPLRSFAVLARRWLMQPQNGVILVEGPAEPGLAAGLSRRLADSRVIEAAQLPLRRLAAVLSLCRVFAGNDSGVSHLAAALGVKTRVWFGPTDPAVWCPPGALVSGRKR